MAVKTSVKKRTSGGKFRIKKTQYDFGFLLTVIILLIIGLIMVFSASYPSAYYSHDGNGFYFIERQLIWAVLGVFAMIFTANYDYRNYRRLAPMLLGITVVLLLLVLTPLGRTFNQARRWLGVGSLTIQPSEIAKITLIIFFAYSLERDGEKIKNFKVLLKYAVFAGVIMGLMLLQPHFSVCIIIAIPLIVMLLVAGAKPLIFGLCASALIPVVGVIAVAAPYRLTRLKTFLDPFSDRLGSGWQIIQSLYAIGSGGLFGVGFGNSRQKFLYVSEPQNDFIFAIVCEELGFIGAIAILCIFAVLFFRGMKIAINAPDTFASLIVTGIVSLVAWQVLLNIAVVTSSVPTTGIPLPFFSAGGSSLVFLLAAMGIVINISKYERQKI